MPEAAQGEATQPLAQPTRPNEQTWHLLGERMMWLARAKSADWSSKERSEQQRTDENGKTISDEINKKPTIRQTNRQKDRLFENLEHHQFSRCYHRLVIDTVVEASPVAVRIGVQHPTQEVKN